MHASAMFEFQTFKDYETSALFMQMTLLFERFSSLQKILSPQKDRFLSQPEGMLGVFIIDSPLDRLRGLPFDFEFMLVNREKIARIRYDTNAFLDSIFKEKTGHAGAIAKIFSETLVGHEELVSQYHGGLLNLDLSEGNLKENVQFFE